MAVTAQTFKDSNPEFRNLDDEYLGIKIAAAVVACPSRVWGDFTDQGVALHTAQQVALGPYGRDLKLVNDDGRTVYDRELERLRLMVSSGARVI